MPTHHSKLPDFDSLPAVQGMPQGCAWGIHDTDGKRDHCGTLNLLTPDVVSEAHKEIQKGESVALNWRMDNVRKPGFGRKPLEHKIFDLAPFKAHDDEIHINTQAGSQWDGFSKSSRLTGDEAALNWLERRALGPPEDGKVLQ